MRHYSKVLVELPDTPSDPQEVVVSIDCDVCGKVEFRAHVAHFGTLVRVLSQAFHELRAADDGKTDAVSVWAPSDQKQKVLDYLNRAFPEWKMDRLRERH